MKMKPIQWDKSEMFTGPDGTPGVRYAVSNRDGVEYEFSMHDATIQSMLPQTYWLPVYSAHANNAKIDRIDGRLVILCGFGKPSDPMGNLVLMRLTLQPGFSIEMRDSIITLILTTLAGFGISPDQHMEDVIRSN